RFWQVPDEVVELRVKASANDTINFSTALMRTDTKQTLIIDPASSTSADYDFTGAVLVGWSVVGKTGVAFNSATFGSCYTIDLQGGTLDNCTVKNSLSTAAVVTDDPSEIKDTTFLSDGTGHAIEATA